MFVYLEGFDKNRFNVPRSMMRIDVPAAETAEQQTLTMGTVPFPCSFTKSPLDTEKFPCRSENPIIYFCPLIGNLRRNGRRSK